MPKITEYTSVSSLGYSDVLITDGTNGTKKISATDLAASLLNIISPINNRNIYRGKYLGSSLTEAQSTEIYNGTFKDMFIGDYWTINNVDYVIADIDYFYKRGNGDQSDTHHLVLMPRAPLSFASMCEVDENDSYQWDEEENFSSSPSYLASTMYTTEMDIIISTLELAFDDALMEMETIKIAGVYDSDYNGFPVSAQNIFTKASLLSEPMVFGHNAYAMCNDSQSQSTYSYISGDSEAVEPAVSGGYETFQLSIFKLNPSFAVCGVPMGPSGQVLPADWWLSDLINGPRVRFSCVSALGFPSYETASEELAVRPYFCIQGSNPNS